MIISTKFKSNFLTPFLLSGLIVLSVPLTSFASGDLTTVPAADSSKNIAVLSGTGVTISGSAGGDTVSLSVTVDGDPHTYTGQSVSIPSTSFPVASTKAITVTITHTPASGPACTDSPITYQAKSQVPTAPLVYVSCAAAPGGAGGAFTFTINDQNTQPIKSAPTLQLFETIPSYRLIFKDTSGTVVFTSAPTAVLTDVFAVSGTNGNGQIVDTPVGVVPAGFASTAESVSETLICTHDVLPHTYTKVANVINGSTTPYTMNFTQNQRIVQQATYNPTTQKATVSVTSVAVLP